VALSVKLALSEPPRPLAGMLPCGDRTFLLASRPKPTTPSDRPFRVNIQVCDLFAVQGGTILAARFPAWPVSRRFNTLDAPAYAEAPMVTPHSNEAYLQHDTLSFDCPLNEFNQPLSPHGSQKVVTPSDKYWKFPPPDSSVARVNIRVCDLFAVQGGTILAARFPAWPISRRFNTLDASAYAKTPMVTPHSNEAYLQHAALVFNCPSNKFNQPWSPLGSQKDATPSDKYWSFHLQPTQFSVWTFRCVISSLCKAGRFWLLGFPPDPFLASLSPLTLPPPRKLQW